MWSNWFLPNWWWGLGEDRYDQAWGVGGRQDCHIALHGEPLSCWVLCWWYPWDIGSGLMVQPSGKNWDACGTKRFEASSLLKPTLIWWHRWLLSGKMCCLELIRLTVCRNVCMHKMLQVCLGGPGVSHTAMVGDGWRSLQGVHHGPSSLWELQPCSCGLRPRKSRLAAGSTQKPTVVNPPWSEATLLISAWSLTTLLFVYLP